jgi:hypothetical protein
MAQAVLWYRQLIRPLQLSFYCVNSLVFLTTGFDQPGYFQAICNVYKMLGQK